MKIHIKYKSSYYFLLLVFFFNCSEENDKEPDCLPVIYPDILMFSVADQNTHEDLFFGEDPLFSIDDFYVLRKNIINHNQLDTVEMNSEGGYFHIPVSMSRNALYLSIADTPLDTLVYTVIPAKISGCSTMIIGDLTFNQVQREENVHGRVVVLRK